MTGMAAVADCCGVLPAAGAAGAAVAAGAAAGAAGLVSAGFDSAGLAGAAPPLGAVPPDWPQAATIGAISVRPAPMPSVRMS